MMVIEQGLDPSLDESQRVFSGPLISDLLQKVSYLGNNLILGRWRTATNPANATESHDHTTIYCQGTRVHSGISKPWHG